MGLRWGVMVLYGKSLIGRVFFGAGLIFGALQVADAESFAAALERRLAAVAEQGLEPFARIESRALDECSGIVASRRYPGVFWAHTDSGGEVALYPITVDGRGVFAEDGEEHAGALPVRGARNVDWEDIASDDAGNLWIGDFGNNRNSRSDLALYVVPEVDPRDAVEMRAAQRIPFHYPDGEEVGNEGRDFVNFDCEALFVAEGKPYLLTKQPGDARTSLFRLDTWGGGEASHPLTYVGSFAIGGMVTAADLSPDGRRLLVLTYSSVWMFEVDAVGERFFEGRVSRLPIFAKQCEAIAWIDDGSFLIVNEQREVFKIQVADLSL